MLLQQDHERIVIIIIMGNILSVIDHLFEYIDFYEINFVTVTIRLLGAMIFGALIGFERTCKLRAAGFKTYSLVCVGSAAVMMTGMFIYQNYQISDPARLGAQVISGIGFLGAGTIMVTGFHSIKGLTTAAGLWVDACMGLVIGIGFYEAAIIMFAIILLVMVVGEKVQVKLLANSKRLRIYILLEKKDGLYKFIAFLKELDISILEFEIIDTIGTFTSFSFVLKLNSKQQHYNILEIIQSSNYVAYVDEA